MMKQFIEIIDFTGLSAFIYSVIIGIAAQLGFTEINPVLLISSFGGFVWIVVKSIMLFKKHAIEAAEKEHDLKVKKHEFEYKVLEAEELKIAQRKKAMQELFNITTFIPDEEMYKKAEDLWNKYRMDLQDLVTKEKRGAKTPR